MADGGPKGGDDDDEAVSFTVTGEFCKAISTDHLRKKQEESESGDAAQGGAAAGYSDSGDEVRFH